MHIVAPKQDVVWGDSYRREPSLRLRWRDQTEMWHIRRLGDSLEGDEFQVIEVDDPRLDTVLGVRRVSCLGLHFLIQSEDQRSAAKVIC